MGKINRKAGLIIINNDNKILIGHPTNHSQTVWSIPKGGIEKNETPYDAAVRETYEETNVDFRGKKIKFIELTEQYYDNKKKSLITFIVKEEDNDFILNDIKLKCNSKVPKTSSWNAGLYEMDDFRYVSFKEAKELLHYTQVKAIEEYESKQDKK